MEKRELKPSLPDKSLPPAEVLHLHWQLGLVGYFLGLIAFSGLFVAPLAIGPWFFFGLVAIGGFFLFPRWSGKIPASVWRTAQILIVVVFGLDLFLGGGIIEALVRLNILLVTYRVISPRSRRDDWQLVLVCLFLIIISGVFSVSAWFIPQVLLFTAGTMFFLRRVNRLDSMGYRQAGPQIWKEFRWKRFFQRPKPIASRMQWIVGGVGFLFLIGLSALIFVTIPRLDLDSRFEFLQVRGTESLSGFDEEMGLQDITNILQDNTPALRVDLPDEAALPGVPYWRMLAFDEYTDGRFRLSQGAAEEQESWRGRLATPSDLDWERTTIRLAEAEDRWTFFLEPGVSRYLPLGGPFRELRLQEEQSFRHVPSLQIIGQPVVNGSVFIYQFRGKGIQAERIPDPDFRERMEAASEGAYPRTTTELPVNEASRRYLQEVNEQLLGEEGQLSALGYARRVSEYLQERHGYSLQSQVPSGDKDIVVRWMESGSPAHCEYFAAALVLLLREQNIPARVAVGFAGGRRNAYEGHITVRYSDAHAWTEVYYDGYWHRVDPTPSEERGEGMGDEFDEENGLGFLQDTGFGAFLDGMRMLWYRRIVSFDEAEQSDFFTRQRERLETLGEEIKALAMGIRRVVIDWLRGPWDLRRGLTLLAGILFLVLVIFGVKFLRWRCKLWWWRWRGKTHALHPVRARAGKGLRKVAKKSVANPKQAEDLDRLKHELLVYRYGDDSQWPGAPYRQLEDLLRQMKKL
ncbi:MAG: DUF3488 domain-containing protein [Opitutales bacterium]|nr:DUF3488 domain-containing protein [Opitutales bacterium]MCH8541291.1 DUF3488 and transglutaminase-like domain-containing protein [Opitutales bacterium]